MVTLTGAMGRRSFTDDDLEYIHDKTGGRCHLCRRTLAFSNYGRFGERGCWEVDHSNARANGGTDYLRNLLPACISCNRSKQHGTTRGARSRNGYRAAPLSREKQDNKRTRNAVIGFGAGAAVGSAIGGPPGALVGGILGGLLGHRQDVEPD